MARTMLNSKKVVLYFWEEIVNIIIHILNHVVFRPGIKLISYELLNNEKPMIKYFRVFGSSYCILRDQENLHKFDSKNDKRVFLAYSSRSKAYKVYNLWTQTVMKSINVIVDDNLKDFFKKDPDNIIDITK
jgi:hypothetical protein